MKEPYNLVILRSKRTFNHDIKRITLYTIPSRRILKSGSSSTGHISSGMSKILKIKNIKRKKFTKTCIILNLAPTLPVNLKNKTTKKSFKRESSIKILVNICTS